MLDGVGVRPCLLGWASTTPAGEGCGEPGAPPAVLSISIQARLPSPGVHPGRCDPGPGYVGSKAGALVSAATSRRRRDIWPRHSEWKWGDGDVLRPSRTLPALRPRNASAAASSVAGSAPAARPACCSNSYTHSGSHSPGSGPCVAENVGSEAVEGQHATRALAGRDVPSAREVANEHMTHSGACHLTYPPP